MRGKWLPYIALSIVDTLAAARGARGVRRWTKPALMPALTATALPASSAEPLVRKGFILAMAGSSVGDIALLNSGDRAFVAGLSGFLAGHVGWLTAASGVPGGEGTLRRSPVLLVPLAALVAGANVAFQPVAPRPLRAPIAVYSLVIGLMTASGVDASGKLPVRRSTATAAGAVLFAVSDTVLAARRFRGFGGSGTGRDLADGLVMATYVAAQGFLAYGLLGSESSSRARR